MFTPEQALKGHYCALAEANLEDFVKHVSPVPEGENFQQFSPQTASIRRSVKECLSLSTLAGRTSLNLRHFHCRVRAKMTSSEYKELKDQFLTNYSGELLTPSSNTPSLAAQPVEETGFLVVGP